MGNTCSVLVVGSGGRSLDRSYRTPSFMLEIMRLNKSFMVPMSCTQAESDKAAHSMHKYNSQSPTPKIKARIEGSPHYVVLQQ